MKGELVEHVGLAVTGAIGGPVGGLAAGVAASALEVCANPYQTACTGSGLLSWVAANPDTAGWAATFAIWMAFAGFYAYKDYEKHVADRIALAEAARLYGAGTAAPPGHDPQ